MHAVRVIRLRIEIDQVVDQSRGGGAVRYGRASGPGVHPGVVRQQKIEHVPDTGIEIHGRENVPGGRVKRNRYGHGQTPNLKGVQTSSGSPATCALATVGATPRADTVSVCGLVAPPAALTVIRSPFQFRSKG